MITSNIFSKARKAKNRAKLYVTELDRLIYPDFFKGRLTPEEANLYLYKRILNNNPIFAGKLGSVETRVLGEHQYKGHYSHTTLKEANQNAGIFPPTTKALDRACGSILDALKKVELLGCWPVGYQSRLAMDLDRLPMRCEMPDLEPFFYTLPWTYALKGKKVCIIHPFVDSIKQQWSRRKILFDNQAILPDFNLILQKPPVTTTGAIHQWDTWDSALEDLWHNVKELEFDVALIGCGSYSLPIGAKIRDQGRSAIHLGGSLQLLFGIFGKRWETFDNQQNMVNEAWIRPVETDQPIGYQNIENGCYW